MFPHRNTYKYTWMSPDGKIHNQNDHILVDKWRHSNVRWFRAADCDIDHYLVVAKVRERLAVNKQRSHRFDMESFNLKKLNQAQNILSIFHRLGHLSKESIRVRCSIFFCDKFIFYGEGLLDSHPTRRLEDHSLLFVPGCLLNIFAATLHSWSHESYVNALMNRTYHKKADIVTAVTKTN
jgi:hypothetical protein